MPRFKITGREWRAPVSGVGKLQRADLGELAPHPCISVMLEMRNAGMQECGKELGVRRRAVATASNYPVGKWPVTTVQDGTLHATHRGTVPVAGAARLSPAQS